MWLLRICCRGTTEHINKVCALYTPLPNTNNKKSKLQLLRKLFESYIINHWTNCSEIRSPLFFISWIFSPFPIPLDVFVNLILCMFWEKKTDNERNKDILLLFKAIHFSGFRSLLLSDALNSLTDLFPSIFNHTFWWKAGEVWKI